MTVKAAAGGIPVGRRIHNRYVIKGYLGGGANGQVYEVYDEHQNELVALKLLTNFNSANPWRESQILTGLRGDFILTVRNADVDSGVPFIVTEILRNGTLEDKIVADVGADISTATRWVQQACTGISRLHDLGLLHNDIKPENLFIADNDDVLVGDLGLASLMDPHGRGAFGGTATTMAPEVAAAWPLLPAATAPRPTTVASDVYSLGATLYWLLAGHYLNPGLLAALANGHAALYQEVATHVPRPLYEVAPHVPLGLSQTVMRAIDPTPTNRFTNPADLAAAIGARARQTRTWQRRPPCPGHAACFDGVKPGAGPLRICAVPTGTRTQHEIQIHRHPSGRRVDLPWTVTPAASLAQRLRAAMRNHT